MWLPIIVGFAVAGVIASIVIDESEVAAKNVLENTLEKAESTAMRLIFVSVSVISVAVLVIWLIMNRG